MLAFNYHQFDDLARKVLRFVFYINKKELKMEIEAYKISKILSALQKQKIFWRNYTV